MLRQLLRSGTLRSGATLGARPFSVHSPLTHRITSSEDPSGKPFINVLTAGGYTFKGDVPKELGGGETGPNPKDYAFVALAFCTTATVRLVANSKNWPLKHVEVEIQEVNGKPGELPDGLHAILKLEGDLTKEQKDELHTVSKSCLVQQIFSGKLKNGITSEIS